MNQKVDVFAEFGKPVSERRKQRAYKLLAKHYPDINQMEVDFIVSCAVRAIEKDRLASLWIDLRRYIGLTFYYMLIAHLCTDEGFET